MGKIEKIPNTPAVIFLKKHEVEFKPLFYRYVDHGGTKEVSNQLGIDEHKIVKTLIFEDDGGNPFIVLMNGDFEVSTKSLAKTMGVKSVKLCDPNKARKFSGYLIGGTSPFGTRRKMKVCAQKDIFDFDRIVINGGKRGFLVEIKTLDLKQLLDPEIVDVCLNFKNCL